MGTGLNSPTVRLHSDYYFILMIIITLIYEETKEINRCAFAKIKHVSELIGKCG